MEDVVGLKTVKSTLKEKKKKVAFEREYSHATNHTITYYYWHCCPDMLLHNYTVIREVRLICMNS